jgi:PKD repeat protein
MKTFSVILFLGILASCQTLNELTTKPIAAFTVSNDGCTAACTITFINKSTDAIAYLWEFGDNTTSTQENPTKQFTTAGTYTVKLTATGKNGNNSTQQTVTIKPPEAPIADFSFTGGECTAPCEVIFTNKSINATSYQWNFGDNSTSTDVNPRHTYQVEGTVSVTLTAFGSGEKSIKIQTILIKTALSFPEPETVAVPGGTFQMGSTIGGDTKPVQSQTVTDFRIGKYEITVKQYRDFCTSTGRTFPEKPPLWDWVDDAPIVNVTWSDAVAYCQ